MLTGRHLHNGSQETHWIEEVAQTDTLWEFELFSPLMKLLVPFLHICEPGSERFLTWVVLAPFAWDSIDRQGLSQLFHTLGHVEITFETQLQFFKTSLYSHNQFGHRLAFLESHILIWVWREVYSVFWGSSFVSSSGSVNFGHLRS